MLVKKKSPSDAWKGTFNNFKVHTWPENKYELFTFEMDNLGHFILYLYINSL